AADRKLQFMRRAQALVAILDSDRHAHRVLLSVTAPGRTDTGFHRAYRFAIGVSGLETGIDQLLPDQRQLIDTRTEEVDALTASDLGVQLVFLRDLAEHDQFLRSNFSGGDARYDRVGAILLHIGEKGVVGILQADMGLLQNIFIVDRGQNRCDGGLADFTTAPAAMFLQQLGKSLYLVNPGQVVQLLPAVFEVFANMIVDRDAAFLQLCVDHILEQRRATPATGAGLGVEFDVGE